MKTLLTILFIYFFVMWYLVGLDKTIHAYIIGLALLVVYVIGYMIYEMIIEEKRFHRENKQFYEGLDRVGTTLQNRHDKSIQSLREILDGEIVTGRIAGINVAYPKK